MIRGVLTLTTRLTDTEIVEQLEALQFDKTTWFVSFNRNGVIPSAVIAQLDVLGAHNYVIRMMCFGSQSLDTWWLTRNNRLHVEKVAAWKQACTFVVMLVERQINSLLSQGDRRMWRKCFLPLVYASRNSADWIPK